MIRVAKLVPFGNVEIKEIDVDSNDSLYSEIECELIECIYMPFGIIGIMDEEGKLSGKLPNFQTEGGEDTIVGTVVFVGDGGDIFISLTEEQVNWVKATFNDQIAPI